MNDLLTLIGITLLPFLELRASIPYGILNTDYHWFLVFAICAIANILLAPLVWFFVHYVMHLFLKIKTIENLYHKTLERTQNKIHKSVDKYGEFGLAIFIGIPLPGSGVYSGALAATILGFHFKDYFKASIIGVIIASVIVTLVVLSGSEAFGVFLS
jgi:uncharacterized membrane protein